MGYTKRPKTTKNCKGCGKTFVTHKSFQIFCCVDCQQLWNNKMAGASNTAYGRSLATASIGVIAEFLVCNDLLQDGHEVFRAVSPSCSIDLIAVKGGNILKVEVRTGRYSAGGRRVYCPTKSFKGDTLAIVTHVDRKIRYVKDISLLPIEA